MTLLTLMLLECKYMHVIIYLFDCLDFGRGDQRVIIMILTWLAGKSNKDNIYALQNSIDYLKEVCSRFDYLFFS